MNGRDLSMLSKWNETTIDLASFLLLAINFYFSSDSDKNVQHKRHKPKMLSNI